MNFKKSCNRFLICGYSHGVDWWSLIDFNILIFSDCNVVNLETVEIFSVVLWFCCRGPCDLLTGFVFVEGVCKFDVVHLTEFNDVSAISVDVIACIPA